MQDALLLSARPGIICFALGLPSPELFPIGEFTNACAEMLARGPRALQYGPPSTELKSHVVSLMRARGVDCSEQQIFLTSGAQQAVHLIVALVLDRGREIIAEELCYPGFQQIIEFYEPEILTVPTDPKSGLDVDKVEWYLARGARPAFIYTIPDGHNPLGVSLSEEKRTRLLALSQEYSVPIIEEDPYGFLSYGTSPLKPMRAHQTDLVFYVGSFSKILAPSARVGMLAALSRRFPVGSEWIVPDSGVYVWVRLPDEFDTTHLLETAVKKYGVAFMPGSVFSVVRGGSCARSSLRMNFSYPSAARIEEGMVRLEELFSYGDRLGLAPGHSPGDIFTSWFSQRRTI